VSVPARRDAGLGARAAALLVDSAMLACAFAAANLVLWKSGLAGALGAQSVAGLLALWGRAEVLAALAIVAALAVVAAWRALGGTPGALLLGVTLVSAEEGGRPGLPGTLARLLAALALGGVGLLWSAGGRPALHDRLSGVRLVIEDEACTPFPAPRRAIAP